MFGDLLGKMFDKEKATQDTLQNFLEKVAVEELKCPHAEIGLFIFAKNNDFEPMGTIYRIPEGKQPQFVRKVSIKEILAASEESDE